MKRARWMGGVLLAVVVVASRAWADGRSTDSYAPITKTSNVSATQSATVLWTPPSGQRIVLQGCYASADKAIAFKVQSAGVDVIPQTILTSYGSVMIGGTTAPIWEGAKDATLTYTTSNTLTASTVANSFSILCWGYEENR